nr:alkane-1-monooxygenase [uncultured bacterium]
MNVRYLKYLLALSLPMLASVSFMADGWLTLLPLLYFYGIVPSLELILRPDPKNLSDTETEMRRVDPIYDYLLYLIVPIQYGFLFWFLLVISQPDLSWVTIVGRVTAMGLMCGSFGINVAHELGHRSTKHEQWMSKALLLTSLYMHFFIEHNRGHHRNVGTPDDPATARKGEWLHTFLIRSTLYSYLSAWKIELAMLRRKGIHPLSPRNEMLRFLVIQVALVGGIALLFSPTAMVYFLSAAGIGIFLLETVNYVEHYGLVRHEVSPGKYERTMPHHSWNSDHILGRLMLFELSRHSDHHFIASKKYQVLEHYDDSPQMPTGYPGMIVLACFPPLWFLVMDPRVERWNRQADAIAA